MGPLDMPKVALTDAAVKRYKAKPGERIDYFDTILGHGFALRVSGPTPRSPEGRKSWVLFYRYGGALKRLTIEPGYPVLGLADARDQARTALQALAKGEDPAAGKREAKATRERVPTPEPVSDTIVETVIDEFMRRYMEAKKRTPHYIADTRRIFDKHVLPRWRGRELNSITRRDVNRLLDAIVDDGKAITANRVLAAVRKLFNWAIQRGIIDASPVAMVERPSAENERERALSDAEIKTVWRASEALSYPFGPFVRMALVTGQRRSEVAAMRWADIDENERTWTLSSEMTKAGRAHVVPLSTLAVAILADCPRSGSYVFTTRRDRPISGFSKAKAMLDGKVAEIAAADDGARTESWRLHDVRRTAATVMGRLRASRFVIGRVLNHADQSITGIYDRHEYLDEKRQALGAWSRFLENLTNPAPGAKVVPLHREA